MGTVYRKTVMKPMPAGAEVVERKGQRHARWITAKGKTRTAPLTVTKAGLDRIVFKSRYIAKYRNGLGRVVEKSTGCRDEVAARAMLADWERRSELVKANVLTKAEDSAADYSDTLLNQNLEDYIAHQKARGLNASRIKSTKQRIDRVASECGFRKLCDLDGIALERWLVRQQDQGMSPGNRNEFRQAMIGFANWCVKNHRLATNPFLGVPKADANQDRRRKRRALTEAELVKLLAVARRRPLIDAMTVRRGSCKGQAVAKVSPSVRCRLEWLGRERALIYKTLVLTGLRKAELASLTVGQLDLDGPVAYATLHAADEKNRKGSEVPLRRDLASDIRDWLGERLEAIQEEAQGRGEPIPVKLLPKTPLFHIPTGLLRILDRDLVMTGLARRRNDGTIDKTDERGRTIDIHALRHTFGTHLSKGGVAPRTAQAAMRHSDINLTMNVYTDPRLLDVVGALDVLPSLPLGRSDESQRQRATGTGSDPTPFAPGFVPTAGYWGANQSIQVKSHTEGGRVVERDDGEVSVSEVEGKHLLSTAVNGGLEMEPSGIEPPTSALRTQRSPN